MADKIVYFDNASTSYPKPETVYQVCDQTLRSAGNPGRGAHRLAYQASHRFFEARETVADFLGLTDSERLIFTSGCTQSINMVVSGMLGAGTLKAGDRVLVTSYEHNAVMRTLAYHERVDQIEVVRVPAGADGAIVDLTALRRLVSEEPKPALAVFTRASNVTGALLDLQSVSNMLDLSGIPLLLDAAQSAGLILDDLGSLSGVSYYVASGHKGLYGPPGVGILYVREGHDIDPPTCGGTGSHSDSLAMPDFLPDRLEPGTHGVQLAAGLAEGVRYLQERGLENILAHEEKLARLFFDSVRDMEAIEIRGRSFEHLQGEGEAAGSGAKKSTLELRKQTQYLPVVSFSYKGLTADRVADWLDTGYGIAIRSGLHCAISAHRVLNSEKTGLARLSFGAFNSEEDVEKLLAALKDLAKVPA